MRHIYVMQQLAANAVTSQVLHVRELASLRRNVTVQLKAAVYQQHATGSVSRTMTASAKT